MTISLALGPADPAPGNVVFRSGGSATKRSLSRPRTDHPPSNIEGVPNEHAPFALICDENSESRSTIEQACLRSGFRAVSARNPFDVVGHVTACRPRVLIVAYDLSFLSLNAVLSIAAERIVPTPFLVTIGTASDRAARDLGLNARCCLDRPVGLSEALNALAWVSTQ